MITPLDYPVLLLVHCAATVFMVGVIWFVQLVHYPLFHGVGADRFADYAKAHQRRTSWVVIPAMLAEAATAPLLVMRAPSSERLLCWLASACLAAVWASTFLQQVPRHRRLSRGYDRQVVGGLVRSNALRTALWTAKGGLCWWLAVRAFL